MTKTTMKKTLRRMGARSVHGTTLMSLLVATVIMGIVLIAMSAILGMNTRQYTQVFTRSDSLTAARFAIDKMGRLVRMARTLGDVQGEEPISPSAYASVSPGPQGVAPGVVTGNTVSLSAVESGSAINVSAHFPSSADYLYNPTNGVAITGSSPYFNTAGGTWPWGSTNGAPSYILSQQCLIVQVQCFDPNGMPECVSTNMQNLPALDTYVFNLVPDTTRPGPTKWWQLQMAVFPAPLTGSPPLSNMATGLKPGKPITICSGIVGPLAANPNDGGNMDPCIFEYVKSVNNSVAVNFDNTNTTTTPTGATNEADLVTFKGVIVNLEVMNVDGSGKPSVAKLRSELYLRNNSSATVLGE
jgi:hypothetical protein